MTTLALSLVLAAAMIADIICLAVG